MEPEKAILKSDPWLREANRKAKLLQRCLELKPHLSAGVYQELLRAYEAIDNYLNKMDMKDLENFTRDLEVQYERLWKGTK